MNQDGWLCTVSQQKSRQEPSASLRKTLRVDCSCCEIALDTHVFKASPNGPTETMQAFALSMGPFYAPSMTRTEFKRIPAPVVPSPPCAQELGVGFADYYGASIDRRREATASAIADGAVGSG